MPHYFTIHRQGRDFFCSRDGAEQFFVGRRVPYEGNIGLYNIFRGSPLPSLNFKSSNYAAEFGFWAEFIEPTAQCEGRNFLTLNSYDRAAFTFGFGQFAAHVPDGDFVRYFRSLLARPDARDFFPSLEVRGGRIHKIDDAGALQLETASSTAPLMAYLNPSLRDVEDEEVIAAARLISWTMEVRELRLAQIQEMIRTYKGFMREASRRGLIEGRTADQCCVIGDLLHQGRGGRIVWSLITEAVRSANPLQELLEIGAHRWGERTRTLGRAITANPNMRALRWNGARQEFI